MENFIRVQDVAKELECSESHAYSIMRKLNKELKEQGFITIAGRLSRQYFYNRLGLGGMNNASLQG